MKRALRGDCLECAANSDHHHRMTGRDKICIWQRNDWPHWVYDRQRLAGMVSDLSAAGRSRGSAHARISAEQSPLP